MDVRRKYRFLFENGLPFCIFILLTLISFREFILGGLVHFGRDDSLTYQVAKYFFSHSIKEGQIPLWNPYVGMGYPNAAEGQNGLFYPFMFLFLIFPFYKAYVASIVICYPLFAFFVYRLGRTWGLSIEGAIISSVAVAFSGVYLIWQGYSPIITTLLWFPLVLLFLIRACRGEGAGNIAIASLIYALMIFSGNTQVIYAGTIFAFFFLWMVGDGGHGFRLAVVIRNGLPVFILGVLMGAVQLIPLFELAYHSERTVGIFNPAEGSLTWNSIQALGAPIFYGPDGVGSSTEAISGYIGYFGTLLALTGFLCFPRKLRVLVPVVVVILLAFGGWTNLGLFRMSGRMLFFLGIIGGLLAGYGFDRLAEIIPSTGSIRLKIIQAGGIALILSLFAGPYFNLSQPVEYLYLLLPQVVATVLLLGLTMFATRARIAAASTALILILGSSVYINSIGVSDTAVPRDFLERPPGIAVALNELADDGRVWIMLGDVEDVAEYHHRTSYGPRALMYGLTTVEHETLSIEGVRQFYRMALRSIAKFPLRAGEEIIPRAEILAGVKYIVVPPDVAPITQFPEAYRDDSYDPAYIIEEVPGYSGLAFFIFPRSVVFEDEVSHRPDIDGFIPDGEGMVESLKLAGPEVILNNTPGPWRTDVVEPFDDPNRLVIEYAAPEGSFMFISQIKYPGWIAYVNGRPEYLYRAYGIFSGVVVNEPLGRVELVYRPMTWIVGGSVSLAAWVFWLWLIFRRKGRGDINR